MQFTPNFDIAFADTGDNMSIEDITSAMATSVDDALSGGIRTYRWADSSERNAQTGMGEGDIGYQSDTGILYIYRGASWVMFTNGDDTGWVTISSFSNGFSARAAAPPSVRRIGNMVMFRGELYRSSAPTSETTAFTIPSSFPLPPVSAGTIRLSVLYAWQLDLSVSPSSGNFGIISSQARSTGAGYPISAMSYLTD